MGKKKKSAEGPEPEGPEPPPEVNGEAHKMESTTSDADAERRMKSDGARDEHDRSCDPGDPADAETEEEVLRIHLDHVCSSQNLLALCRVL